MKKERRIAHEVFRQASQGKWNPWRKHYEALSINDLIFINMGIDAFIRDQVCSTIPDVIEVFEKMYADGERSVDVVEVGCYKGRLSEAVLKYLPKMIKSWVGYDVNYYALEENECRDGRYTTVKQTEWFYDTEFFSNPNTFLAMSTIEHHSREQFLKILEKMRATQSIKYLIIGMPVDARGWDNYGGSHVLEMGKEEISGAIEDAGFKIFHHERRKVYMWGAKRK